MRQNLRELRDRLLNDFGKTTRWELLCKQRHVTTLAEKTRLAQEVLSQPMTRTVAEWYTCWTMLYGFSSRRLEELVNKLNMAKLLHFQRLCKERHAATAADQIKIADELLSWGPLDTVTAGHLAWARLKGSKPKKATPYKPTGF